MDSKSNFPLFRSLAGLALGSLLGFGWYSLIGCTGLACPLTSTPWIAVLYGGLLGFFIAALRK